MLARTATLALSFAVVLTAAGCGGSDSPDGSLEVSVTPALYRCGADPTGATARECRAVTGVASLRCSPDELSYSLPEGVEARKVDAGDACERVAADQELRSPTGGATCARPRGRVSVVGELNGDPVRVVARSCGEADDAGDAATEWARLVGLPFASVPT